MDNPNKRRRNDISPITENIALNIINILDRYPILYKTLQASSSMIDNPIIVDSRIVELMKEQPVRIFQMLVEQIYNNFNTYLSEYFTFEFDEITNNSMVCYINSKELITYEQVNSIIDEDERNNLKYEKELLPIKFEHENFIYKNELLNYLSKFCSDISNKLNRKISAFINFNDLSMEIFVRFDDSS
jgi:hypothetical protein